MTTIYDLLSPTGMHVHSDSEPYLLLDPDVELLDTLEGELLLLD